MNNTFNAFVKFISDDPIMLGLCIAIIVLIIAFILVLFLGRKKDDKEECIADNTSELLKTEVNMDALKSTQEFSLNELQGDGIKTDVEVPSLENKNAYDNPIVGAKAESDIVEVPVNLETNPVAIEVPEPTTISNMNSEIATTNTITSNELPKADNPIMSDSTIDPFNANIFDINTKEEPVEDLVIESTPLDDSAIVPIVESTVNPVDSPSIPSLESVFGASVTTPENETNKPALSEPKEAKGDIELPTITGPIPKIEAPFSSVNVDVNAELPNINMDELSKTEIIRHVPIMEEAQINSEFFVQTEEEDLDEIDLPMFNNNTNTVSDTQSNLNSLKGETFDI